jgi:hypothetical protein
MEGPADDMSDRAERWRWKRRAESARSALAAAFAEHGRGLAGDWCDLDESHQLTERCEALGPSPSRVIQRWPAKERFLEVTRSCWAAVPSDPDLRVLVMDTPDAAWIRLSADAILADLVPAAGDWMSDGFIVFHSPSDSLLSVDVEERNGFSVIETTIIGGGFDALRQCYAECGPPPLPISDRP